MSLLPLSNNNNNNNDDAADNNEQASSLSQSSTVCLSPTIPRLTPLTFNEPNYEDLLIGTINELVRDFLTRIDRDYSYDEEFEWTLNLRHNIKYNILLRIHR